VSGLAVGQSPETLLATANGLKFTVADLAPEPAAIIRKDERDRRDQQKKVL
jgi:hypothetical protein